MSTELQSNLIDISSRRKTTPVRRVVFDLLSTEDSSVRSSYYEWCDALRAALVRLQNLPSDWDGYGAEPISHQVAIFAFQVLIQSWRPGLPTPDITPLSDGSILVEWFGRHSDLTVEVHAPYSMSYFSQRAEGEIGNDLSVLASLLGEYVSSNSLLEAS
jgi:hypothetical protein